MKYQKSAGYKQLRSWKSFSALATIPLPSICISMVRRHPEKML